MAKIITVCNQKGGTGKTTIAKQVALGLHGKRLLIDSDPQANLTCQFIANPQGFNLADLYVLTKTRDVTIDDVNKAIYDTNFDDLSIIPSHRNLVSFESDSSLGREKYLSIILKFINNNYDYIIIDTPPSIGMLTINCLVACTHTLIVTEPRKSSVDGVEQMVKTLTLVKENYNYNLDFLGIIVNKYSTTKDCNNWCSMLEDKYKDFVFKPFIKQRELLNKANTSESNLINSNKPLANDFNELVNNLLTQINIQE